MPGHRPTTRASVALTLAALLAASGCAGDGETTTAGDGQFAMIQSEVFNQSCIQAACHDSATRQGNLDLTAGTSYGQLVGVEPENSAARVAGLLRVEPDSDQNSYLLRKLTGDLAAGEGSPMPLGLARLAPVEIEMIRSWILAGAPAD